MNIKQNIYMAITSRLFSLAVVALALIVPVTSAFAGHCDIKNSPPPFIRHNLTASPITSVSFCELCGYGYVTIIVSNPYEDEDMTNMTVV